MRPKPSLGRIDAICSGCVVLVRASVVIAMMLADLLAPEVDHRSSAEDMQVIEQEQKTAGLLSSPALLQTD